MQDDDRVRLEDTTNNEPVDNNARAPHESADPVVAEELDNEAHDTGSSSPDRFQLFPESQRFTHTTPANRKYARTMQATPQSENPLAGSIKSSGPTIPLSQVFDASSPTSHALRSEMSDLPSPNIPISFGPPDSLFSNMTDSPSQSGPRRIQQQATYISMRSSQAMREQMAQKQISVQRRPSSHGFSDDDFSQEGSYVQRQLRDRKLDNQTRKHLAEISAPARAERKSTDDFTKLKSSSPLVTSPSITRKPPRRHHGPIDIPEPEFGVLSGDSEVETEQEDEPFRWSQSRRSQQRQVTDGGEEEEDKENFNSHPVTLPESNTNPASRTHEALSQIMAAADDQVEPPSRHSSPLSKAHEAVLYHSQESLKNANTTANLSTFPIHSPTSPPEVMDNPPKSPTPMTHERTISDIHEEHAPPDGSSVHEEPTPQEEPRNYAEPAEKRISSQKSSKDVIPDSHSQSRGSSMVHPDTLDPTHSHTDKSAAASFSRILATPSQNLVHQATSHPIIPDSIANPLRPITSPYKDHADPAVIDTGYSIFSSPSGRRRRRLTDIANSQSPRQPVPSFDQTTPFTADNDAEFEQQHTNKPEKPWHRTGRGPRNHMPTPFSDPSSPKPCMHNQAAKDGVAIDNAHAKSADFSDRSSLTEEQDTTDPESRSNGLLDEASEDTGPHRKRHKVFQQPAASSMPRRNLFGETTKRRETKTVKPRLRRTKSMSNELTIIEETRQDDMAVTPGEKSSPVPSSFQDEVQYPDQVFAFFNGRPPGYYPATCLGVLHKFGRSHYTVKFDDATECDNIDEGGVKRLELHVNDVVKIDIANKPRGPYVVLGFSGMESALKTFGSFDCQTVPDIVGHEAVKLRLKADPASPVLTVPISVVYLDRTLWARLINRRYIPSESLIHAQAEKVSDHSSSTPFESRMSTYLSPSNGALFSNMAFSVSFKEKVGANTTRGDIESMICANGGRLLDGFDSLFHTPSSSSDDGKEGHICPAASAERLGFVCLITDSHSRRVKYMQALAINVPCLASRWVQDCIAANCIVPWETYSLPAGESSYLGAVKSRDLPIYPPLQATFAETFSQRRKPLSDESVIFLASRGKAAENKKAFVFLVYAMGPRRIRQVPDLNTALELLQLQERDGNASETWGWLYAGEEKTTATVRATLLEMLGVRNNSNALSNSNASGSRGVKRQRNISSSSELNTADSNDSRIDPITVNGRPLRFLMNDFICQSLILGKLIPGY